MPSVSKFGFEGIWFHHLGIQARKNRDQHTIKEMLQSGLVVRVEEGHTSATYETSHEPRGETALFDVQTEKTSDLEVLVRKAYRCRESCRS